MPSQKEILEANEAEVILNSEVFKKAVAHLKEEYMQKWENSSEADSSFREDLHKAIRILPEVEKHLRIIIEKGRITKTQLDKIVKMLKLYFKKY